MKGTLTEKRKQYYTMIWEYQSRRLKAKEKFGLHSELFDKKKAVYDRKIKVWRQGIRRIDKLHNELHKLERSVVNFTGIPIMGKIYSIGCPKEVKQAKYLYYKFGLEQGIRGKELREYLGVPVTIFNQPYAYRKTFTNSFHSQPGNKEIWLRFKEFYAA